MASDEEFEVVCPYCGEEVQIFIEEDVRGSFVQDCEVCCNPWLVKVTVSPDGRDISVSARRRVGVGPELRTPGRDMNKT